MKSRVICVLLVGLSAIGCQSPSKETGSAGETKPKMDKALVERAAGIFDMQYNDRQINFIRTLSEDAEKPFSMLRLEKDGSFKLAVFNKDPKTQKYKGVLGEGKVETNGNEFTFVTDTINKKKEANPKRLVYRLDSTASAFVHRDGTTFLKRSDPEVKAGNANLEEYLPKLKAEEERKKKALPTPKNR